MSWSLRTAIVASSAVIAALIAPSPAGASACTITIAESNGTFYGTTGPDVICITGSNNVVYAMAGDDEVIDEGEANTIDLGDGSDSYDGSGGSGAEVGGGTGDDDIVGTPIDDAITGGEGEDDLIGGFGDDLLSGGEDADSLQGEAGADTLQGESGDDGLSGGLGDDVLAGGDGVDRLDGGAGLNMCDYSASEPRTATCRYDAEGPSVFLTVSPRSVDVSESGQQVTVSGYAEDALGVAGVAVWCGVFQLSWYLRPYPFAYTSDGARVSSGLELSSDGRRLDFSVPLDIAVAREPGTYVCKTWSSDIVGNTTGWVPTSETLTIIRTGEVRDREPPAISLSISPNVVDVSSARQEFTLSGQATDPSGLRSVRIECGSSLAYWYRSSGQPPQAYTSDGRTIKLASEGEFVVSDDGRSLSFTVSVGVAYGTRPGSTPCTYFAVDGLALHPLVVGTGPTLTVLREGDGFHDGPPDLEFDISPETIDVGVSRQQFLLMGRAVDGTGIHWITISCGRSSFGWSADGPAGIWTHDGNVFREDVEQWITSSSDNTLVEFSLPLEVPFGSVPGEFVCTGTAGDQLGRVRHIDSGPTLTVFRTPPGMPSAPTGLGFLPTPGRPSEGVLSWDPPVSPGDPALQDYEVSYSLDGVTWTPVQDGVSLATSLPLLNLRAQTDYWMRVRADNGGNSLVGSRGAPWSDALLVTTPPALVPTPPQAVTVTEVTTSSARLTWSPPEYDGGSPVSDYTVEMSRDAGTTWRSVPHAASDATAMVVTGLAPGTSYLVRISASNAAGASGHASSQLTTTTTVPAAVSSMESTNITESTLTLTWRLPASNGGLGISDYVVEVSRNGSDFRPIPHAASISRRFKVTGLRPETRYWFRVAAVNANGVGAFAPAIAVTTLGAPPGPPTRLGIRVSGSGPDVRYVLTWRAPSLNGAFGRVRDYVVEYTRAGAENWKRVSKRESAGTSVLLTGLAPRTQYLFRVIAVNDVGQSTPSRPLRFATR